ncbi:MAG: SpoIID/LytB domain-containing protein [Myxococcales bacterium]|nr:SpoIID/LytB domain-containing protein [Myxococcales bacterium]
MGRFAWISLAALLCGSPAWAEAPEADPAAGRFSTFVPLSQAELYAKRMRFTAGEPMISVGIMEHQPEVVLQADGPVRLMFDEASLPKAVYAPPGTRFTFRPLSAKPPELRHWVVVETAPYLALEQADETRKTWEARGYPVKTFEVGTIVALQGNVLDTRARQVAVGGYPDTRRADKEVARIFRRYGLRTFIHEELARPPEGVVGVYDDQDRLIHRATDSVYFGTVDGGLVEVRDVEHSRGYKGHGRQHRQFWGHIYVSVDRSGRLAVVNSVGAEKLLQGLVPAEIFATAPLEALKAQAVTARGEIFSKLGHRHFGEPFHLCSEQHCQVYAGAGHERPASNQAVAETRGLLAFRPREDPKDALRLVDSVYSSTCGGFSEANEAVWDDEASESLRSKLDAIGHDPALAPFEGGLNEGNVRAFLEAYPPTACARSSFVNAQKYRWRRTFTQDRLRKIGQQLGVGEVKGIEILGRGPGGRITGLRIRGSQGKKDVLRELPVRRLFGNLNSGLFVLDEERGPDGALTAVTFVGGGWGHGVGMCQMGAIGRAERGHGFRQILGHYYNGAVAERIY